MRRDLWRPMWNARMREMAELDAWEDDDSGSEEGEFSLKKRDEGDIAER